MNEDKHHHIQLEKCWVVLKSSEINYLLMKDSKLFAVALKRAKAINRNSLQKEREKTKYEREGGI